MSPLGFAFGAAGGAGGGFAPAFETIMRNRQVEQGMDLDERALGLRADDLAFRMDAASEERAQRDRERGLFRGSGGYTTRDPDELLSWERQYVQATAPVSRPNFQLGEVGAGDQPVVFNPDTGDVQPLNIGAGPAGSRTGPDPLKLPVGVQQALAGAEATQTALDRYRSLVEPYMERGRTSRALGAVGFPDEARDRLVGQIESAQKDVQINAKELANLGVLNGPDMDILNDLIGDPLSTGSVVRDPQYTLAKLDAAERFIEGRLESYHNLYGMQPQRIRGVPRGGVNLDVLRNAGHGPQRHPDNPWR